MDTAAEIVGYAVIAASVSGWLGIADFSIHFALR